MTEFDKFGNPIKSDPYGGSLLDGEAEEEGYTSEESAIKKFTSLEARVWYLGAAVGVIGVLGACLIAAFVVNSVWTWNVNPNEIDDMQHHVKNIVLMNLGSVPPREVRFASDPYPGYQWNVAKLNDDDDGSEVSTSDISSNTSANGGDDDDEEDPSDDDEDTAVHDGVMYGHTEVVPRFAKDGSVLDGQFDVSVPARFHGGGIVNYGATTSNCTNTDALRIVHADSDPVTEGMPVGFWGSHVGAGFRDFKQDIIAEAVPENGQDAFTLDEDTVVMLYTDANLYPTVQLRHRDDSVSIPLPETTTAYVDDDDECRYAGAAHSSSTTHFLWAWKEPADNGGLYQFCRILSEAPFTLSCTAAAAFDAANEITIRGVSHLEGTNDFVILYTSDANGLEAFAVTVDTNLLTEVAGATVAVDAAATNLDCQQAQLHARGTIVTVVYTDDAANIAISGATFTVAAGVITPVVAATAIATPDEAVIDSDILGDYTVMSYVDDSLSAGDRVLLFHQVASGLPVLVWQDVIDFNLANSDRFPNSPTSVTAISDDTVVICHQPREFDDAHSCQPWTLDTSGATPVLIPGDDNLVTRFSRGGTHCAAFGAMDGSFTCVYGSYATGTRRHSVRAVTGAYSAGGSSEHGGTINFVEGAPNAIMGLALHDALPGEPLAVRLSGCFDFENTSTRFGPQDRNVCLFGNGEVRPHFQVSAADIDVFVPRCGCRVHSSKVIRCGDIDTWDVRLVNGF